MKTRTLLTALLFISLCSFKGGKELLVDIIAKHDKIPVVISPDSKATRYPLLENADKQRNYMPLPEDLKKLAIEAIIENLNKGFKTEAFYLKSMNEMKRDEIAKDSEFFVSATLKATYSMSTDASTGGAKAKLDLNMYAEFYSADGGKPKKVNSGPSGMRAYCKKDYAVAVTSMGVNGLLIQIKTHCVQEPTIEIINKKMPKFCQKQIDKASK